MTHAELQKLLDDTAEDLAPVAPLSATLVLVLGEAIAAQPCRDDVAELVGSVMAPNPPAQC